MPRYLRSSSSEVHANPYGPPQSARRAATFATPTVRAPMASDAQAVTRAAGPNPLWAINVGMGLFFALAAAVIMLT